MGIYIFSTDILIEALEADALDQRSSHDFGNDIIPKLLGEGKNLYTYEFNGFWKDVGTISSFHETSMDLLGPNPEFDLFDKSFPIMSNDSTRPPHFIGPDGQCRGLPRLERVPRERNRSPFDTLHRLRRRGASNRRGLRPAPRRHRKGRGACGSSHTRRERRRRRGREARKRRLNQGYRRRRKRRRHREGGMNR